MKIKNVWSLAAFTSIAVAVTACSGNPVDTKKAKTVPKTALSAKKIVKAKNVKTIKKVNTAKRVAKKATVPKTVVADRKETKPVVNKRSAAAKVVQAKPLTRVQTRVKKQSIAALAKSRQEQARLKYLRAQNRKKHIENQRLNKIKLARSAAIQRNAAKRSTYIANWKEMQSLGLDRFAGSQEDVPVRRPTAKQVRVNTLRAQQARQRKARAAAIKAQQLKKRNSLMVASRTGAASALRSRQPVKVRSTQPIRTRSTQPVRTRARQGVATRSRQPVRTRSRQAVQTRARQPVRTRARQPVRSRAIQYAARAKAPAKRRVARVNQQNRNLRRVSAQRNRAAARQRAVNRPNPRVRRAVYKRPAKRRAISRIDPNVSFGNALSRAAIERTKHRVRYDGKYLRIGYPWGDVPKSIGVCTDVVIRAYRRLGIDLQSEVHKDISHDFYAYPNLVKWGLTKPDPNIDHRRVYNLQAFFKRHKAELPRSRNPRHYRAGDLVTWMIGPNFPHIGVVVNKPSKADPNRLMIAHNIGHGPQIEDILFKYPMTGHYRYTPKNRKVKPALLFAKTPPPANVLRRQRNKGLSYAEVLQANKIISGKVDARSLPSLNDLLAKGNSRGKSQEKITLTHLDATIFGETGINQDALKALLK